MTAAVARHQALRDGLRVNAAYRVVAMAIQFAVMLVLVRVLSPKAYGEAAVVSGFMSLLSVFSVRTFVRQAMQLPDGEEPEWNRHFSAGFYIQLTVSALGHIIAGICWSLESHRAVAPLLHIAALALLLDWPNQLGGTMCLREMDFRRMRLVEGGGMLARQAVTLLLALSGAGSYAIVVGFGVGSLPFMLDLFLFRKWRPPPGWWRWPDWDAYKPALKFGAHNVGTGILQSGQDALAGVLLPGTVGYIAIGLWGRALGLFSMTMGQCQNVLSETIYPLLPRYTADAGQFARVATSFARVMLLVMVPGTIFLVLECTSLSRVLYGTKWIAADPLLRPGILAGLGALIFTVGSTLFVASNRLRLSLTLSAFWAIAVLSALVVPTWGGAMTTYAWTLACLQLLTGAAVLGFAGRLMETGWLRKVVAVPTIGSAVAAASVISLDVWLPRFAPIQRLAVNAVLFGLTFLVVLRLVFPRGLTDMLTLFPGGERVKGWLGLQVNRPV